MAEQNINCATDADKAFGVGPDLQNEPLALNERWRITADGLQWIAQQHRKDGSKWDPIIYCQTQAGLISCLGWEVFSVGEIAAEAWSVLKSLPRHRRFAPGYDGVDVEREIARTQAQDRRDALEALRKDGGRTPRWANRKPFMFDPDMLNGEPFSFAADTIADRRWRVIGDWLECTAMVPGGWKQIRQVANENELRDFLDWLS